MGKSSGRRRFGEAQPENGQSELTFTAKEKWSNSKVTRSLTEQKTMTGSCTVRRCHSRPSADRENRSTGRSGEIEKTPFPPKK